MNFHESWQITEGRVIPWHQASCHNRAFWSLQDLGNRFESNYKSLHGLIYLISSWSSWLLDSVIEFGFSCVSYREGRCTEHRLAGSLKRPGDGYSQTLTTRHHGPWTFSVHLQIFRNPQFANTFTAYKSPSKSSSTWKMLSVLFTFLILCSRKKLLLNQFPGE